MMVVGDKRKYLTCLITLKVLVLLMLLMMAMIMMYLTIVANKRKKLTCLITLKVFVLLMNDNGHGNDMLYQVQDIFPSILSKMI